MKTDYLWYRVLERLYKALLEAALVQNCIHIHFWFLYWREINVLLGHVGVVTGTYCTDLEDWDLNLVNSPGAVHSAPSCNKQEREQKSECEGKKKEGGRKQGFKTALKC